MLFCHDLESGKVLWDHRLSGAFWASPLVAGDLIYFFCNNGKTFVLEPGEEWKLKAENEISPAAEGKMYGYALAEGKLIFRFDTELIAVGGN